MLNFSAFCPHPPIIIDDVGSWQNLRQVKKTIAALEKLGEELQDANPQTIVLISPHAPLLSDAFFINNSPQLYGNLNNFGSAVNMIFPNDLELVAAIAAGAKKINIPTMAAARELDHGTLVPLSFLSYTFPQRFKPPREDNECLDNHADKTRDHRKVWDFAPLNPVRADTQIVSSEGASQPKLVHLGFSFLDFKTHFHYGEIIGEVCEKASRKIALIASGDLSHRLTRSAPAGYSPHGAKFDKKLLELLKTQQTQNVLSLDQNFVEEAGECGFRSLLIALGALKNNWTYDQRSYEGPFGVGYLTARLK